MHPLLLSSDFDPMQMAIIVIAVFAGFIKWLWETWQQKQAAPPPLPPDPEEQRLREAAWRRQTGQDSVPGRPPPLPPVAAPSPWDELRKAWGELQEAMKTPASAPARPVRSQQRQTVRQQQPAPARTQSHSVRAALAAPAQRASAPAASSVAAAVASPTVPVVAPVVPKSSTPAAAGGILGSLQHLRRDPALMRQAILMQEILGPPKALQSSGEFAN